MIDYIVKLKPFFSEKIWGWEKWNISTHRKGSSIIENGKLKGRKLSEFTKLPILVKIINTKDVLSVQVHPDDEYARLVEEDNGKTECWYIKESQNDSSLIIGLKGEVDSNTIREKSVDGSITELLNEVHVEKGDFIHIPSGMVHAIGKGIKLIEVQQSSDITYRLYDWGRGRETHIDKSIDVIDIPMNLSAQKVKDFKCIDLEKFKVEKIKIDKEYIFGSSNFETFTVIEGSITIEAKDQKIYLEEEESAYIPENTKYKIYGCGEVIKASI